ncbi:TonB-dependent receptor [Sphingobium lignivorans]|uniref:Iron complex outermembrane receptor protein n=1 Tax=Sphingobium lignivorans TaxID=2735886 RepID=A0ABR6NHV1_9SPHN|nr:TonB-dependent receptor [Sphingobium lignivorans]MBB5986860.1 iron complex outermembrane receptor protein [Sphingobium lignivorans]
MKKVTLASASLLSLAISGAAMAQEEASRAMPDDIIVTATKMATNVQDVPIAITAVTAETLMQRSITSSADLGAIVPNATFRQTGGAYGRGLSAFMRGIGQADTAVSQEPGVAFYVDDVYYPLIHGSIFDLLDLQHVEVLRGPQGTLFGRNSLAGAINLVSREPEQDTSAYVELTTGIRERFDVRAGFNVPLTDTLALRVSGFSKNQRGFQERLDFRCEMIRRGTPELAGNLPFLVGENIAPASNDPDSCVVGHNGGTRAYGMRGALKWEPAHNLAISLIGDYSNDTSPVQPDQLLSVDASRSISNPGLAGQGAYFSVPGETPFIYDSRFVTGDPYKTYATYRDAIPSGTVIPGTFYNGSVRRGGIGYEPINPVKMWGVTGKLVYGLTDQIDFTFIAGYRDVSVGYTFDVDQSPLTVELTRNLTTHTQHTLEARLAGRMDWIDWVVGAFHYRAEENERRVIIAPFSNLQRYRNDYYQPKNDSIYANVTLRPFGDRLGINLGGRYSDDSKPLQFDNRQDAVPTNDIVFDQVLSTKRFDWKAGLSYELNNSLLAYASAATGFRLPSFNSRPFQPSQIYQTPGDELVAYEFGMKGDFFDRRLRLNGAAFYTDYKQRTTSTSGSEYQLDPQGNPLPGTQVTEPLPGGPAGSTRCRTRTPAEISAGVPGFACVPRTYATNTPGKVYGIELELRAEPVDGLTIDGSLGYAKFDSPDLKALSRVTDRLIGVPEWNASAGVQYEAEVPALAGTITPRVDWYYQGAISFSAARRELIADPYSLFNARLTYKNEVHDFSVSLAVTNVFNKFYYVSLLDYSGLGFPNTNAQPSVPREWALTLRKQF